MLKKIRKAGRREYALNLLTYIWFANFPLTSKYYIYPGFFTDEETKKKYPATTIVFPLLSLNYISQSQVSCGDILVLGIRDPCELSFTNSNEKLSNL